MRLPLQHHRLIIACVFLSSLAVRSVGAGDWPMWRYDAGRGASTPHALATDLKLQWVRQLPASRPAWPPTQTKLQFDVGQQPVVLGKRIFVPSNATDSVTAYDTDSGKQLWRFYADAPVRFAPVAHNSRVYFVSDDAHLYAVDVATGKLIWKLSGAPAKRPILGNQRLISSWPARGGPVLYDGKIFFTTSIWPFMGIFVHAVDPDSGKIVWTNSGDGTNYTVHPHGAPSFGTVVPQGHLAAAKKKLVVPGGRSVPAVYDATTGKLLHFKFDKRSGGHHVTAAKDTYFAAGNTYSLANGSRLSRGAPVVHDANAFYYQDGQTIRAMEPVGQISSKQTKDRRGRVQTSVKIERKTLFSVNLRGAAGRAYLKAGDAIYTAGDGRVSAHVCTDGSDGKPIWEGKFDGHVWTMLAADDKLFVVTTDGLLYCFGAKAKAGAKLAATVRPITPKANRWAGVAKQILQQPESQDGFAISMGIGTGRLIEQILLQSKIHVIVIDPDAAKVNAFRRKMDAGGLYGSRVSAQVGTPGKFPFPPYLANLIFCEDAGGMVRSAETIASLYRPLRPYGGTAYLPVATAALSKIQALARAARLENATVKTEGSLVLLVRQGALPETDDWTHQYGNAAQTVVSRDKRVKAPLGLLWFGGASHAGILPRHGHGPSPQVAGGRLVIEGPDMLRCVDVYTGRVLWEKSLKGLGSFYNKTSHQPGAGEIGSNYVTLADHIYVVYGDTIVELDAATGKTTQAFKLKPASADQPAFWGFLAVSGDYLIATSSPVAADGGKSPSRKPFVAKGPDNLIAIIKPNTTWSYLAGSDPTDPAWTRPDFNAKSWEKGQAGFGYGDGDDRTVLNMKGKYTRVYVRATFDKKSVANASDLGLMLNYDDAFIAYLNGKEVARSNVSSGFGAKAGRIGSHEASGYEYIPFNKFANLIRPGLNVIAIEGHNTSANSSDFSLDPYLVIRLAKQGAPRAPRPTTRAKSKPPESLAKSKKPAAPDRNVNRCSLPTAVLQP